MKKRQKYKGQDGSKNRFKFTIDHKIYNLAP